MLTTYGIHSSRISVKNPQANAICERMHQTVHNILQTLRYQHPPTTNAEGIAHVDYALALASHALRSTAHSTLHHSPGSISFHRDMLLDFPFIPDLIALRARRQQVIDTNLHRENHRRRTHDYQPGDQVFQLAYDPNKLAVVAQGPYRINLVHTNGTITIQRTPTLVDRLSIRRVRPYFPELHPGFQAAPLPLQHN